MAVLSALFKHIGIEQMQVSNEALREGLIYDMIGRSRQEDARERTVRSLSKRYNVDQEQAQRVESTALALYHQVIRPWEDARFALLIDAQLGGPAT